MEESKLFGWRPFTPERRAELSAAGFPAISIEEMERKNVYAPSTQGVQSLALSAAMLDAIARRHGVELIDDVKHVLERRASSMASSADVHDQVEASIIRELIDDGIDWSALTDRASDPKHDCWTPTTAPE